MHKLKDKKYKRILLKLSGEAFQNRERGVGIDGELTARIAERVKRVQHSSCPPATPRR